MTQQLWPELTSETSERILYALRKRDRSAAVKIYREAENCSLEEAEKAIARADGLPLGPPPRLSITAIFIPLATIIAILIYVVQSGRPPDRPELSQLIAMLGPRNMHYGAHEERNGGLKIIAANGAHFMAYYRHSDCAYARPHRGWSITLPDGRAGGCLHKVSDDTYRQYNFYGVHEGDIQIEGTTITLSRDGESLGVAKPNPTGWTLYAPPPSDEPLIYFEPIAPNTMGYRVDKAPNFKHALWGSLPTILRDELSAYQRASPK